MRRLVLLALSVLTGCTQSLPSGIERIASGSDSQAFFWSPASRRLAYVEGRFPDRTYLIVINRATKERSKWRMKGFVLGAATALSRDGRRAFLDAGKIGPYASRSEPVERVILTVDIASGRVLSETPVGVASVSALGHPAWSPDPIAVWNSKEGIHWRSFGQDAAAGFIRGEAAWRSLLLDEPYLVVAEKQTERPRMTVYDLRSNLPVAEWRVALTGTPLALRPDGTALSARWMSETGSFVLESGDPKTGRRVPLLEAEGEIESALETDRGLYAIAKDPSRRNDTGKDFLAPRVLLVAESGGKHWSTPWTSHHGKFLGSDPANGRLLFAVNDRDQPAVWSIAPSRSALAAAGPTIDGHAR